MKNQFVALSLLVVGVPAVAQTGADAAKSSGSGFNPQFSIILDGTYADYSRSGGEAELPGFFLGGEAGLPEEGFALGHTEFVASANIDQLFYGKLTVAIAEHDGETEVELEEAFVETVGLGHGFTVRAGRLFSAVGYLNQQHEHAWDFVDAPLVYRGLWGRNYIDDGARVSWIAPTTTFIELGVEGLVGRGFPVARAEGNNLDSTVAFANFGGDFSASSAWQAGISYHQADVTGREAGGHAHGGGATETPSFTGDSDTWGLNFIYKWAPNGNYKHTHFKLQGEYFQREEEGDLVLLGSNPLEQSTLSLEQSGFYLQGVYQFRPQWRVGLRYDRLDSDATGSDVSVLDEAELVSNENPWRATVALEWLPSEFSRVRLQFNRDNSGHDAENQIFIQYTMSLGAHGAHTF